MGRPCMAVRLKHVKRSIDRYDERKETKGKIAKKMKNSVRKQLEEIGAC